MIPVPVHIIAAVGLDGELGYNNRLIWRIPADLRRFKELTMGNTLIMGRKTYQSIGKALPGRFNIVLTHQADFRAPGVWVRHSAEGALDLAGCLGRPVFVIGGESVYRLFLPLARSMYLTLVDERAPQADTFFPQWDRDEWVLQEQSGPMEDRGIRFRYAHYVRRV